MQQLIDFFISHWTDLRWIGLVFLMSFLYGLCNRTWFGRKPLILVLPLDLKIPLIPWTVYIYNLWYPIMILSFSLLAIFDKPVFYRLIPAYVLASMTSFLIFIFFQNEVPRTDLITGSSRSERLLRFTRQMDNPYNGFPSIHVLACTMTIIAVQTASLPTGYKVFIWISQTAIILTTLTTKQHVILDLFGGASLATLSWLLTGLFLV